jgi:hypothetical protein
MKLTPDSSLLFYEPLQQRRIKQQQKNAKFCSAHATFTKKISLKITFLYFFVLKKVSYILLDNNENRQIHFFVKWCAQNRAQTN